MEEYKGGNPTWEKLKAGLVFAVCLTGFRAETVYSAVLPDGSIKPDKIQRNSQCKMSH